MHSGSLRRSAEVHAGISFKSLKLLAEVSAEVFAEVAEVGAQVIEIACGGLRRFCGGIYLPLRGRGRGAGPRPAGVARGARP